jgi:hypothetical protein
MIGSTRENPILMAANNKTRPTSHLYGLRYLYNIFIIEVEAKKSDAGSMYKHRTSSGNMPS